MDMGRLNIQMAHPIQVNSKMIKEKDMDISNTRMGGNTKDNGKTIEWKAMEFLLIQQEKVLKKY